MKTRQLLSIAALAFCGLAFATGDHGDEAKAHHGGVVSVVKDVSYELVASGQALSLYVRDHGKTPDLGDATAKLTLLTVTAKQEVELKSDGVALRGGGSFAVQSGTKVVAQVSLKGKPVQSVRFTLK